MNKRILITVFVATTIMTLASIESLAASSQVVQLGGLRQVHVAISDEPQSVDLRVAFTPVACFDPGTNERVNKQKAGAYAKEALAQHLHMDRNRMAIRGMQVLSAGQRAGKWEAHYRIDKASIVSQTSTTSATPPHTSLLPAKAHSLLSRKGDYMDTITTLSDMVIAPPADLDAEKRDLAIAEMETTVLDAFRSMEAEIRGDILLLDIEKHELFVHVDQARRRSILRLSEFVTEEAPHAP